MLSHNPLRRVLRYLALSVIVSLACLGCNQTTFDFTSTATSGHYVAPMHRVALWAWTRGQRSGSVVSHTDSRLLGVPVASCDFYPQWTISILAKRQVSPLGLLPIQQSRFGRAPPSRFL
jgi:hypothetical protein